MVDKFITLSTLRRVTQFFAFIILVYGSLFFSTFYTTDKLTNALPALSCAYDMAGSDYCVLIPLQHQIDHRVSLGVMGKIDLMQSLLPTIITLATFFALIVILNKAFCGWLCPLGFFQEVINYIGNRIGIKQIKSLSFSLVKKIRPIKWVLLLVLIFIFPLLTGLGFLGHELGSSFCAICPSRILTTLAVGDSSQVFIDNSTPLYLTLSIIADTLFGLMIALALFVRQPFCRICPILPMQSIFKKFGLLRLVKNGSSKCENCGQCVKACPMDIYELQDSKENKNITHQDCTLCGRCVEFCPDNEVLSLKYAPLTIFKSSNEQFKKRLKIEKWIEK